MQFNKLNGFNLKQTVDTEKSTFGYFIADCGSHGVNNIKRLYYQPLVMWHAHNRTQAATSVVFFSRFHFSPLSKKHVTWCLHPSPYTQTHTCTHNPPPPQYPPPTFQREGCEVEGKRGEKDHPHWDHSPSIRPFHTLWTWNNQVLIAAVCLCRPWLKPCRLTVHGRSASAAERTEWTEHGMLHRTHKQRHTQTHR